MSKKQTTSDQLVKAIFQSYVKSEVDIFDSLQPAIKKIVEQAFNSGLTVALQQSEILQKHIFLGKNAEILDRMKKNSGIFVIQSENAIDAQEISDDLSAYQTVKDQYDELLESSKAYECNSCNNFDDCNKPDQVGNVMDLNSFINLTKQ